MRETKRWVTFYSPGSFFENDWTQDIFGEPDPKDISWPDNAHAFTVHEREDIIEGEERFKGETKQIGPRYYHPESRVETLAQVERNPNSTDILIRNMKANKWDKVIWSRWGNHPQPMNDKTLVL